MMKHWISEVLKIKKVLKPSNFFKTYTASTKPTLCAPLNTNSVFDDDQYIAINQARLNHLQKLGLPLDKQRVLDVGCGPGYLSSFFIERQCQIVGVDGRPVNIERFKQIHPTSEALVLDVEKDPLSSLGQFDVVFCYGLLYHVEHPGIVLQNLGSVNQGILLLETIICDSQLPIVRYVHESEHENQALHGIGCRPSPQYIVMKLRHIGFPWIYRPICPPDHPDFQFFWKNNLDWQRKKNNLRCVIIASRYKLSLPTLVPFSEH